MLNPAHFNLFLISIMVPLYFLYVLGIACFVARRDTKRKFTVGLFHPYCNAGGGGERVLWVALRSLQEKYSDYEFVVYTGDVEMTKEQMIRNSKKKFNIELRDDNVKFVYLKHRGWVEAEKYPSFTLLGQSIGSMFMGLEAVVTLNPDVFIDTMGYAFTLPIFKYLGGANVACYVHYPTISTDMLDRVESGKESYNNRGAVANSSTLSSFKLWYYKMFAKLYSIMGRSSAVVMVNSSWTENHINKLWDIPSITFKVYPPCDVEEFKRIEQPDDDSKKEGFRIVSVAQFRPEKDHALQLRSLSKLKDLIPLQVWKKVKLVLVGSVRNKDDQDRVDALKELSLSLGLNDNVEFHLNVSFEELKNQLKDGLIGIHTMWNEHFGIGIVECMAAGLIMVAHKSGGPMMDILIPTGKECNGYLASNEIEYAEVIQSILNLTPSQRREIRKKAKNSVDRFSEHKFSKDFLLAVKPLMK